MALAIFDLDNTLLAGDSITAGANLCEQGLVEEGTSKKMTSSMPITGQARWICARISILSWHRWRQDANRRGCPAASVHHRLYRTYAAQQSL